MAAAKQPIGDSYIVTFGSNVTDPAAVATDLGLKFNGKAKHVYKAALKGAAFLLRLMDL